MQACELQPPPRTLTAAGRADQLLHLRRGGGPLSPKPRTRGSQPAAAAREGGRSRAAQRKITQRWPSHQGLPAASDSGDLGAWQALPEPRTWPQALTPV